jgi:3-oxoacyl-[acyl-carrier-protein] synthase I
MNSAAGQRAVVLTGLGFITPLGHSAAAVAERLRTGRHGLSPVTWFPDCPVRVAGLVPDFDTASFNQNAWRWPAGYTVPRETLRGLPPHGLYALCALQQALRDAGLPEEGPRDERTGLFTASAGSPGWMRHHLNELHASGGTRGHPLGVLRTVAGTLNFNLAAHFGIRGSVTGFTSACAASAHALGYAADEIRLGRQDRMLVVGAEEPTWESLLPFDAARAMSRAADPGTASRPFDRQRDGFVGSGGAVALVLEAATVAAARGARVWARWSGWGQSGDGHRPTQSDPTGDGLSRAMTLALRDAGLDPGSVDYVSAHATSTVAGDRSEALALRQVFGDHSPRISSTKGLTGHPLSMSGAFEAAICALALHDGFTPGNAHLEEPDEACARLDLPRATLPAAPRIALSNSSGFGGSNVVLVLARADVAGFA